MPPVAASAGGAGGQSTLDKGMPSYITKQSHGLLLTIIAAKMGAMMGGSALPFVCPNHPSSPLELPPSLLQQATSLCQHSQSQTILTFDTIAVGLIIGFIFGATNIIRYGPGPNGMMRTLGQYMLGSSATFGYASTSPAQLRETIEITGVDHRLDVIFIDCSSRFFMSIGTTIRTESSPILTEAFAAAQANQGRPVILKGEWERRMRQRPSSRKGGEEE